MTATEGASTEARQERKSWNETEASECRYGDVAGGIWGDWNILWEDSEADYQGHASFLAEKDGKFCFYEWWYGSCSGCDTWEAADLSYEEIEKEMRDTALWLDDRDQLIEWLDRLDGKVPASNLVQTENDPFNLVAGIDILSGGILRRVEEMRKAVS